MIKFLKANFLTLLTILILIIGFSSELTVPFINDSGILFWPLRITRSLLNPLHLGFFNSGFFFFRAFGTSNYCNYINLGMYFVLFYGFLLYLVSKKKEARLLKLFFSVMFASTLMAIFIKLLELTNVLNYEFIFRNWAVSLLIKTSWMLISFKALKSISNHEQKETSVSIANKSTRVKHYLLDCVFIIIIFSPYTILINEYKVSNVVNIIGVAGYYWLLKCFYGIFYYLIFEGIHHSSPAKFYTNSFIIRNDNGSINFIDVIKRVAIRLIPFYELSIFSNQLLHDKWSNTKTLSYNSTKKFTKHLIGLPISMLLFFTLIISIFSQFSKENTNLKLKKKLDIRSYNLRVELKKISTSSIIVFQDIKTSELIVLETHFFNDSTIRGELKKGVNTFIIPDILKDGLLINKSCGLSIKELENATVIVNSNDSVYTNSIAIAGLSNKYNLLYIFKKDEPLIELNGSGHFGNQFTIGFNNVGYKSNLIAIKNISGNIDWQVKLPKTIIRPSIMVPSQFKIKGRFNDLDKPYAAELTFVTLNSDTIRYLLSGKSFNMKLEKIN